MSLKTVVRGLELMASLFVTMPERGRPRQHAAQPEKAGARVEPAHAHNLQPGAKPESAAASQSAQERGAFGKSAVLTTSTESAE